MGTTQELSIDNLRKKLIQEERERYLKGEGRSFTWEEIKAMALNKSRPHVKA
jgi:hypothetical protein